MRGEQAEDLLFDQMLFGVRQFEAVLAEHFQTVVPVRVVRRRNHHARHERAGACEVGYAGSGDHPGVTDARALAGQPSGHHPGNPLSALASVRAYQDLRVGVMSGSVFAQRHPEGICRQRVQRILSRHSANSIGSEQLFSQTFSLTCSPAEAHAIYFFFMLTVTKTSGVFTKRAKASSVNTLT